MNGGEEECIWNNGGYWVGVLPLRAHLAEKLGSRTPSNFCGTENR
jgi:hypothetical protein